MTGKRTEQIAVRITQETKSILTTEAQKLDWSVAKLAERILREWTETAKNGKGSINFVINHNETIHIDNK